MKMLRLLSTTFTTVLLLANTAHATVVDFIGTHTPGTIHNAVDMGHTSVGQTGTLYDWYFTVPSGQSTALQTGYIPANSSITFTYNNFSTDTNAYGYAQAAYNYTAGPNNYTGLYFADTTGDHGNTGSVNGVSTIGSALLYATANINDKKIVTTISNYSSVEAVFDLFQWAFLSGTTASATYAVSSVPLPATLPMFAMVVMGLFGVKRFRRKKAAA